MSDTIRNHETGGAVNMDECPTRRWGQNCRCDKCKVCGFGKHMAVHGPAYGQPPGSKPWGHVFVPTDDAQRPPAE